MNTTEKCFLLLEVLKAKEILPKHIQKTKFRSVFFYNIFDSPIGNFIFYNVATGVDTDESLACLKGLVEHFERLAFSEAVDLGLQFPESISSDGYAGFPTIQEGFEDKARKNALAEAIERYVWAHWWDCNTQAEIKKLNLEQVPAPSKDLIDLINEEAGIEVLYQIQPFVENYSEYKTIILFAALKGGGFISGGACGTDIIQTQFRATTELVRHHLAFSNFKSEGLMPSTFYEKRLIYFAEGTGDTLVKNKLRNRSTCKIILPELIYDQSIPYSLDSSVYVHRCLFENQPPFVAGALERLCL